MNPYYLVHLWLEHRRQTNEYHRLIAERDRLILEGVNPDDLKLPNPPKGIRP